MPKEVWVEKTDTKSDLSGDKCLTPEKNASLSQKSLHYIVGQTRCLQRFMSKKGN
jgi:hypothetical protein